MTLSERSGIVPDLHTATVAGAAAGNLTVTGIDPNRSVLLAVQDVSAADENLAEEFTVSAADTINNTGGTNTTGMVLLVIWVNSPRQL